MIEIAGHDLLLVEGKDDRLFFERPLLHMAQAYLAAMPELVNSTGLGAVRDLWNFDSPVYDELKEFLKLMAV